MADASISPYERSCKRKKTHTHAQHIHIHTQDRTTANVCVCCQVSCQAKGSNDCFRLPFFFPGLCAVVYTSGSKRVFLLHFLSGFCCTGKTGGRKSKPYRELKSEHLLVHFGQQRLRGFVRVLVGCVTAHVCRRDNAVAMQHMFGQRVSRSQCLLVKARCRASPGRAAGGTSSSNVNVPLLRVPNMLSLKQLYARYHVRCFTDSDDSSLPTRTPIRQDYDDTAIPQAMLNWYVVLVCYTGMWLVLYY